MRDFDFKSNSIPSFCSTLARYLMNVNPPRWFEESKILIVWIFSSNEVKRSAMRRLSVWPLEIRWII